MFARPFHCDMSCLTSVHSCTIQAYEGKWQQIWQLAVRSVSIPSTCRAACVLLHAILQAQLLPYHEISDDVNNIVTMADICGPAILVDSSLILMHRLTHLRNSLVPSASQVTSSHIIRWVFTTWKPGEPPFLVRRSLRVLY